MIRCEGAAAAGEHLDGIAEAILDNLTTAVESETDALKTGAKRRCPLDTGRLRDSIRAEVRAQSAEIEAGVGSGLEYAAAVELGTIHQPPVPYLAPELRSRRNALVEHMKRAVRRALKGESE